MDGGTVWFVGLGGGTLLLALAILITVLQKRKPGGDPNHAWKQAAAETGHPEVAKPDKR